MLQFCLRFFFILAHYGNLVKRKKVRFWVRNFVLARANLEILERVEATFKITQVSEYLILGKVKQQTQQTDSY